MFFDYIEKNFAYLEKEKLTRFDIKNIVEFLLGSEENSRIVEEKFSPLTRGYSPYECMAFYYNLILREIEMVYNLPKTEFKTWIEWKARSYIGTCKAWRMGSKYNGDLYFSFELKSKLLRVFRWYNSHKLVGLKLEKNPYYEKIKQGWRTEDLEELKVKNLSGKTVAHLQAAFGWTTENIEILKLADGSGWTVAHEQANRGWTTENPEILTLTDKNDITVLELQLIRGWIPNLKNEKINELFAESPNTYCFTIVEYWKNKLTKEENEKMFLWDPDFAVKAEQILNFCVQAKKTFELKPTVKKEINDLCKKLNQYLQKKELLTSFLTKISAKVSNQSNLSKIKRKT